MENSNRGPNTEKIEEEPLEKKDYELEEPESPPPRKWLTPGVKRVIVAAVGSLITILQLLLVIWFLGFFFDVKVA